MVGISTLMHVPRSARYLAGGVLHSFGTFRFLHERLLPGTVSVLMYHGLIRYPLPVRDWCFLQLERFERQMEYLVRHFEVVHLEDAFASDARRSERPLACVTFDDGFGSVYELALPILERLRIPATVYLVTDLIDSRETVWFARLHQAICQTWTSEVGLGASRFRLTRPPDRIRASAELQRALKPLRRPELATALEDLFAQLRFDKAKARPWDAFRILTTNEIQRMTRDDLVRFGAHTASHQILTRTTPADARHEIERSVAAVAALVERPSRSFAYPNGGPDDFDASVVDAVQGAGIQYAVSTIEGPNGAQPDPYAIRRYGIGADDPMARFGGLVHHARDTVREIARRVTNRRGSPSGTAGAGAAPTTSRRG
jgi:peptidoglycan/xylan/chitin deacetylase (PgdA/CDA1 family)